MNLNEINYSWLTAALGLHSIVTLLVWLIILEASFGISEIFQTIITVDGGIWIPAVLTVLGSFLLYRKRNTDRRQRLERAFAAEIKEHSNLAKLPSRLRHLEKPPTKDRIPPDAVPPAESLPTLVYENNVGNIARLDDQLAEEIVSYYSLLIRHKATINMIQEEDHRDSDTHVLPMSYHKDLFDDVGHLRRKRRMVLNKLKKRQ
ncbi:hypothetical protein [Natronorubrum sulfidifaciens]|uniref:hypothetical protein n=1 Tax=Natronorubrum sulfidifaciens TaxID=388259 RepID=UPI001375D05F|nr:hypothetical protein [Natronorubrum sulfidifaciens]